MEPKKIKKPEALTEQFHFMGTKGHKKMVKKTAKKHKVSEGFVHRHWIERGYEGEQKP